MTAIDVFSAGYWLVPMVEVVTYGGDQAVIQDDVFFDLVAMTGLDPLIGSAGGIEFELFPDRSMPDDVVAVPDSLGPRDGDVLLLSKQRGCV